MNTIRVKSGSFEIEIQTDQPQTPKQMAEAIVEVVKAAPPRTTEVIEKVPALPATIVAESTEEHPAVSKKKKRSDVRADDGSTAPSAEDRVEGLIIAGKFEQQQGLKDVHAMLQRMALTYSVTHTANALASLVRKDKLERIGNKGQYKYVRKGVQVESPVTSEVASVTGDQSGDMTLEAAMSQAQA